MNYSAVASRTTWSKDWALAASLAFERRREREGGRLLEPEARVQSMKTREGEKKIYSLQLCRDSTRSLLLLEL